MPYSKIHTLKEWNEKVSTGEIQEDFDQTRLKTSEIKVDIPTKTEKQSTLDMVMLPIECPHCRAKLWEVSLSCLFAQGNMNHFFKDTDRYIRCMNCHWKGFRKVAP